MQPDEKLEREIQEASSHAGPERGFAGSNLVGLNYIESVHN